MAFNMYRWLENYGFGLVTEGWNWWAWPNGLPYLALDLMHEGQECVIQEYRDEFPIRQAIGTPASYTMDGYTTTWLEYRFPWPKTRAQAEAIAEAMGWHESIDDPPDTPLPEFTQAVDELLEDRP